MTWNGFERQLLDALSELPPPKPRKPIDLEDLKRAARRGAREARRFLAENPTQDHMQSICEMYECEMHNLDDSPVDFAYYSAYLEALQRRVTKPQTRKKQKGCRPILTVMDDYGTGSLLWLNWIGADNLGAGGRGCEINYRYENSGYRCGLHPLSDELFKAFKEWIAAGADASSTDGALVNPDDPMFSDYLVKPAIILNWSDFHVRGLELAQRLKEEVGAAFRVIYEKSFADPARENGQRFEVFDDGSIIELPPRCLFRLVS